MCVCVCVHACVCVCVHLIPLSLEHSDTHFAFNCLCETKTDKQLVEHTEHSQELLPDGTIIVNLIELISDRY